MTEPSTSLDPLAALAPPLALALASHFGSPAGWRQAFGAAATTGAAGWLELAFYCVYGHEVGRATALRLRALGVDARYLDGGIDAWQRAGRPTEPKAAA